LIISYVFDPENIFETNIRRCSAACFISGPHRPSALEQTHATEVFLKPLEQLGIHDCDSNPRINLAKTNPSSGALRIAAHPGSGSPQKNWPEAKWLAFLDANYARQQAQLELLRATGQVAKVLQ